jgi:hypothetical protein
MPRTRRSVMSRNRSIILLLRIVDAFFGAARLRVGRLKTADAADTGRCLLVLAACGALCGCLTEARMTRLVWDRQTLRLLEPEGTYGRMTRLNDGSLVFACEKNGAIQARRSADAGRTGPTLSQSHDGTAARSPIPNCWRSATAHCSASTIADRTRRRICPMRLPSRVLRKMRRRGPPRRCSMKRTPHSRTAAGNPRPSNCRPAKFCSFSRTKPPTASATNRRFR